MKILIITFSITILALGCKNNNVKKVDDNLSNNESNKSEVAIPQTILGSYVGNFGSNKITVIISKINNDSIEGRSIVGGNDRTFVGTIKKEGKSNIIQAKEPGGEEHDGEFNFHILSDTPHELSGTWKPYKPTAAISEKAFSLHSKTFKYDKSVGQFPQASSRILKDNEVDNLLLEDLKYMRNEIFARHGYCFKKRDLRQQFETKEWYVPNTIDIKNDLTDIEMRNIALIKKYEKYAVDYGDDFGR